MKKRSKEELLLKQSLKNQKIILERLTRLLSLKGAIKMYFLYLSLDFIMDVIKALYVYFVVFL